MGFKVAGCWRRNKNAIKGISSAHTSDQSSILRKRSAIGKLARVKTFNVAFGVLYEITLYFINKNLEIKKLVVTFLINSFQKYLVTQNTTTMSKYFNFKSIALFFSISFFISSCSSDEKKTEETTNLPASTTTATTINNAVASEPKRAALIGTLDTLTVEASKFSNLRPNKKVVFSFTFRNPDTLTLWGWQCQDNNCTNNFLKDPDLPLVKGKASSVQYGPNVIFGNVVIFKKGIDVIMDSIDKGYQEVVFVPANDGEYIKYKIYVRNNSKTAIPTFTLEDTGIETNPSPPKNNTLE